MVGRRSRLGGGGFALMCFAVSATAMAQPADPTPDTASSSAEAPKATAEAPAPPDAAHVRQRLNEALAPQPGGLRAADVARRAEMSSPEVRAKQQAVAAAAAKVDQAAWLFLPRATLLARYVRLSEVASANLSDRGSILGTDLPAGQPVPVVCPMGPGSTPDQCYVRAQGVELSFPILLNMWTLQGTLAIPLSDYVLRLSQNHASATNSKRAAETQEKAARVKTQLDAKTAYFNWIRAQGGLLVAEAGLATAGAHLKDVRVAFQVGSASRADVLAVESQVASTEMLVENSKNMTTLTEEQLRVMMHDPERTQYRIGENIDAPVADEPASTTLNALFAEAMRQRLERRVIDETVASLRETRKVLSASNYPRLDAFGNLYHQNPNTRVFPQQEKWSTTWDVGVQLSWTINDTFTTGAQVQELDAKILEIESQRAQLDDGIRLQVTQAYNAFRQAQVGKETTERQLVAAEESYRVRRELFRAGRATSSELTDAETALVKAGFDGLNARIDLRLARENLDHALGRDAVRP
ncbi:MAG: Outer membrane efflux protein [Deltaproteobacteria bacterium ADurb.Bin207]|nr:MAG: Outer membrane efflux protein [Deltaproteobacteria bacterium ADurb.Bin207]